MKDLDLREFSSENSSKAASVWEHQHGEPRLLWTVLDSDVVVFFVPHVAANAVYNLYAVSNHSGTTMGGHYTAYCRNPSSGEWYTFNDSRYVPPAIFLSLLHNV